MYIIWKEKILLYLFSLFSSGYYPQESSFLPLNRNLLRLMNWLKPSYPISIFSFWHMLGSTVNLTRFSGEGVCLPVTLLPAAEPWQGNHVTNGRWSKLPGIKYLVAFRRPYPNVGKDANKGCPHGRHEYRWQEVPDVHPRFYTLDLTACGFILPCQDPPRKFTWKSLPLHQTTPQAWVNL